MNVGGVKSDLTSQRLRLAGSAAVLIGVLVALAIFLDVGGSADADVSIHTVGTSWHGTEPVGPIITEIVSSNASTLEDEDGDRPDWVEVHNPTSAPIDLDGYFLSDDDEEPARWPLPAIDLAPGDHLVVFASGKDRRDPEGELHSDFRLARGDEPVLLIEPDGATIADRITAVEIPRNASFGRPADSLAQTCYFAFPSPERLNTDDCFPDVSLGAPSFSHSTGFYDDPFDLEITAHDADATIYYTLDGSYPDPDTNPEATLVYNGPLAIVDRTPEPNGISMIPTTVPEHPTFVVPEESIPKGTTVRARTRHSATSVATLFVGEVPPQGDLSVVTLTIDPRLLFDHEVGIMVGGRLYEEWRDSDDFSEDARWSDVEANYMWRGREWERPLLDELHNPVTFDFCPSRRNCDFQQDVGLRIHGGQTRSFANKSLRLYARGDYGPTHFDYDFFENGNHSHARLILRNGGNDRNRLGFADAFLQSLMWDLQAETQSAKPVSLYINGEYWGHYNLRERFDEQYVAAVHGLDPNQVEILDNSTNALNEVRRSNPPPVGFSIASPYEPELLDEWTSFVASVSSMQAQGLDIRNAIESTVDTESLFDFIIAHTFSGSIDWPHNNTRWWRSLDLTDSNSKADGRWRWMISDLDSWGRADDPLAERLPAGSSPEHRDGLPLLFQTMMADRELQDGFVTRFADLLNTAFASDSTVPQLRAWEGQLGAEREQHERRWPTDDDGPDRWEDRIDLLATFLAERPAVQREQLRDRFGLGQERRLRLEFDGSATDIIVNTVRLGDYPAAVRPYGGEDRWDSTYFDGQTMRLQAVPAHGYRFSYWLLDNGDRLLDSEVSIRMDDDVGLQLVVESVP